MQITIGKILSLLVAIGGVIFAFIDGGTHELKYCFALIFPLGLIGFRDEIGSATGYFAGHSLRVDVETPSVLISIVGWIFLLGLPVLFHLLWKHG